MTANQIATWANVGVILVNAGITIVGGIQNLIKTAHPDVTEAEVNTILDWIINDATIRKARAEAEARN